MYALIILPLIPLYGWWCYRSSRSLFRLATVLNTHDVDLGFLSWDGKSNDWLLFSDVRFVIWLLRRKHLDVELPEPVIVALDEARRDYVSVLWINAGFLVFIFAIAQL